MSRSSTSSLKTQYRVRVVSFLGDINGGLSIVDVGVGEDSIWSDLPVPGRIAVLGTDIVRHHWRPSGNVVGHVVADARVLPFGDNSFDVAFAKDLLHHVGGGPGGVVRVLTEMRRVARKDVVIIESNRRSPLANIHMVLLKGHRHLRSGETIGLIRKTFKDDRLEMGRMSAHLITVNSLPKAIGAQRLLTRIVEGAETVLGLENYEVIRAHLSKERVTENPRKSEQ